MTHSTIVPPQEIREPMSTKPVTSSALLSSILTPHAHVSAVSVQRRHRVRTSHGVMAAMLLLSVATTSLTYATDQYAASPAVTPAPAPAPATVTVQPAPSAQVTAPTQDGAALPTSATASAPGVKELAAEKAPAGDRASSLVNSLAQSLGFGRKATAASSHDSAAHSPSVASPTITQPSAIAKAQPFPGAPGSLAPIVEKLVPCVVNISTQQTVNRRGPIEMPQLPPGSALEQFFGEFFEGLRSDKPRKVVSLGSGFIIDPEGYVVTNNHVIADADEITVILQDETELKATIVGRDSRTDLAVLKVNADKKLQAVEWGDSTAAKVGDWVFAIGNPFGLGGTVTAGIISARSRDISRRVGGVGDYVDDFIQTDASINVGNSGGPMFDMTGRVIGVNTAILSPNGTNIGIGFSLPADVARTVVEQIRKVGHVKRGWIGVYIQKIENDIAESFGLKAAKGALVGKIAAGGPAEKAGFEHGDVITTYDGQDVSDPRKLTRLVGDTPIGKKVAVKVWRHRKEVTLTVTIGELKDTGDAANTPGSKRNKATARTSNKVLGMALSALTPENREQFGIKSDTRGVLVIDVAPNSVAARKGIRPGDVIVEAAQTPVSTPEEVAEKVQEVKKSSGKSLLILLNRDDSLAYEALKLESPKKPQVPTDNDDDDAADAS